MRRRSALCTWGKSVKVEDRREYNHNCSRIWLGADVELKATQSPARFDGRPPAALPVQQEIHAAVWYRPANLLDDVPLAALGFPYQPLEVLPGKRFASRARAAHQHVPPVAAVQGGHTHAAPAGQHPEHRTRYEVPRRRRALFADARSSLLSTKPMATH